MRTLVQRRSASIVYWILLTMLISGFTAVLADAFYTTFIKHACGG